MTLTRSTFLACVLLALCGTARGEVVTGSSSADLIDLGLSLDLVPELGGGSFSMLVSTTWLRHRELRLRPTVRQIQC